MVWIKKSCLWITLVFSGSEPWYERSFCLIVMCVCPWFISLCQRKREIERGDGAEIGNRDRENERGGREREKQRERMRESYFLASGFGVDQIYHFLKRTSKWKSPVTISFFPFLSSPHPLFPSLCCATFQINYSVMCSVLKVATIIPSMTTLITILNYNSGRMNVHVKYIPHIFVIVF